MGEFNMHPMGNKSVDQKLLDFDHFGSILPNYPSDHGDHSTLLEGHSRRPRPDDIIMHVP